MGLRTLQGGVNFTDSESAIAALLLAAEQQLSEECTVTIVFTNGIGSSTVALLVLFNLLQQQVTHALSDQVRSSTLNGGPHSHIQDISTP